MNYFVDFDHTLYNTDSFVADIIDELSLFIANSCNIDFKEVLNNIKSILKNEKFCDFYNFIDYLTSLPVYNFNKQNAIDIVNDILMNGGKYLFEDSLPFIKYLKSHENKIYLLSYNDTRLCYQTLKIAGSGILDYVDGLITTSTLKGDMPLDFKNSVFIDDKPRDLISIFHQKPLNVFRIRRPNEKHSFKETGCNIAEFFGLDDLKKSLESNT